MSKPRKPSRTEQDALSVELRKTLDELSEARRALAEAQRDSDDEQLAADYALQRRIEAAQKVGKLEYRLQKLREQL